MTEGRWVVSACLLGNACRYDGRSNYVPEIADFVRGRPCLAVCPEKLGGLCVPRLPCEIAGSRVVRRDGLDVTEAFALGVERAMETTRAFHAELAIVKDKSPSCGLGLIYDGSFSRRLVCGNGLWVRALLAGGIVVFGSENFSASLRLSR